MNARMLSQLVASYQQSTGLGPEEVAFIEASARELAIPASAVAALIELYRQGRHGAPAQDPQLVDRFAQALATDRPLSADDRALITELGGMVAAASAAPVPAASTQPPTPEPGPATAAPVHPPAQLLQAIEAQFQATPLADDVKRALLQKAAQLGVPAQLANALLGVQQMRLSQSPDDYPADALDRLVHAMVSLGTVSEADHALLTQVAQSLRVSPNATAVLLRLERAVHARSVAEAKLLLPSLTQALSEGGANLPVAGSAFMMRKYTEVSAIDQAEQAKRPAPAAKTEVPAKPDTAPLKVGLNETVVFELPAGEVSLKESGLQIHPQGFNWFLHLAERTGAAHVVVNGQAHSADMVDEVTFSRAGDGYAYRLIQNGKHSVVLRGKTVEQFDLAGGLTFSPDGKKFCAIGRRGKAWHVWAEGRLSDPRPAYREPVYNPVDGRLAYFAFENQRWRVIYDGRVGEAGYPLCGGLTFAPDGEALVFWAKVGNATHAVVNAKLGPPFEGVGEFTFGKTAALIGYLANYQGKLTAVIGHKPGPTFDRIRRLSFSPSQKAFSYIGTTDDLDQLVVNHQIVASFDRIHALLWSADGAAYAAIVQKGRRKRVMVDGADQQPYDEISRLSFSPTGRSLVYQALTKDRQWVVVQDGLEGEPYMDLDELCFSPDGRRTAYFARTKGQGTALVVGGERSPEAQMAKHLVWSADSKATGHMLYDNGGWFICVNGHIANKQRYDEVLQPLRYDELRDCFYTLVRQGNQILTVAYH